jgi:hypothetical protein
VTNRSDYTRFLMKPRDRFPVMRVLRMQHLHRDSPPYRDVLGLEDLAHPAFADEPKHPVLRAHDVTH